MKTVSLGEGFIVNWLLVDQWDSPDSGLYCANVINIHKQDDGAAHCFYHRKALCACTEIANGVPQIKEGYSGLFVYLFVLGEYKILQQY